MISLTPQIITVLLTFMKLQNYYKLQERKQQPNYLYIKFEFVHLL